ncbi:MAG: DUF4032 domain-containing protein [Chloroflexi bacterium]|nr:DUF4032 domain-containing protein [Chloroflexota bacterium]
MSPDYQAPDVYKDKELLDRLGYGILDIPYKSGVGFEDVYRFGYLVQPERAPYFYTRLLLRILGIAFERSLAHAMWAEILRHKYFLSQEAQKDVGIESAARDWYETYGKDFERQWYLKKPEIPQRFPGVREQGPGLAEKAAGLIIPGLGELVEAGFSILDVFSATKSLGGEGFRLLLGTVPEQEKEKYYVQLVARLAGFELTPEEAERGWGEILEHKWYMSEKAGKDVGIKAAALDYFKRLKLAVGDSSKGEY